MFDADAGGQTGVDRALEIFVGQDVELAIATLPDGLDPCDLLVAQGPEPFLAALAGAADALDYKLAQLLDRAGTSVDGTRRVVDGILGVMAMAPDQPGQAGRVKQELLVTRVAHRLGLRQETVWARSANSKMRRRAAKNLVQDRRRPYSKRRSPARPRRSSWSCCRCSWQNPTSWRWPPGRSPRTTFRIRG